MPEEKTVPLNLNVIQSGKFAGWVEMPRFALIDEHKYTRKKVVTDDDGTEKIVYADADLSPKKLAEIAERCNQRIKETGDYCPAAIGHTKDKTVPAKFQPELAGYIKDFRVEDLVNPESGEKTGRKAIYATPFAKPENISKFLENPRRSVELFYDDNSIDPLALLGAETPARDLGVHVFSAIQGEHREEPYRYSIDYTPKQPIAETKMADMANKPSDTDTPDALVQKVFQSSEWKEMQKKNEDMHSTLTELKMLLEHFAAGEEGEAGNEGADDGAGGDLLGQDDSVPEGDMLGHPGADEPAEEPDLAVDEPEEKPEKKDDKKDADKMQKDAIVDAKERQFRDQFSKMEQRIAELEADKKAAVEAAEFADVQTLLGELNSARIAYDPEREVPRLVKMSKQERRDEVAYMIQTREKQVPGRGQYVVPPKEQADTKDKFSIKEAAIPSVGEYISREEAIEGGRLQAAGKTKSEAIAQLRNKGNATVVPVK